MRGGESKCQEVAAVLNGLNGVANVDCVRPLLLFFFFFPIFVELLVAAGDVAFWERTDCARFLKRLV